MASLAPVNDAPVVVHEIADQVVGDTPIWTYTVPASTFTDIDNPTLSYTAQLANGTPLPAWLHFDPVTRSFSGDTTGIGGSLDIEVTATDAGGLSVSDTFKLFVNNAPSLTGTPPTYTIANSGLDTYSVPIAQLIPGWQPGDVVPIFSYGGGGGCVLT